MAVATRAKKAVKKTTKRTTSKKTTSRTARKASARSKPKMSTAHKSALASGRTESAVVRRYLDALEANKPRRGRQISAEEIRRRIEDLEGRIEEAKRSDRLLLVQKRLDLETRLSNLAEPLDIRPLEKAFVKVGKSFAVRKNISHGAFREVGVPAAILTEAGISR